MKLIETKISSSNLIGATELLDRYLAISRAIAGQLGAQNVLGCVADEVREIIDHDHIDVCLILPEKPGYEIAFEVGMRTEWSDTVRTPMQIENSPIRTILNGEVDWLLTDDAWTDDRFHFEGSFDAPIFDANLHSRLHVALLVHGEVQGALNISSHAKGSYSAADVGIARQIADLLAPYFYALMRNEQAQAAARDVGESRDHIESLRLGALGLTEVMEKERKRLGMDLHDQTLADLTRISHQIERLEKSKSAKLSDLEELGDSISHCAEELRRIIEDTRPGVLELFGFAQAVEAQLERSVVGVGSPILTSVHDHTGPGLDDIGQSRRTTLFRIVQEAINNAVQHSSPRTISVVMDCNDTGFSIAVNNDGYDGGKSMNDQGRGLNNMRVRADLVSAKIQFLPDIDNKTMSVNIYIPE